MSIRISVTGNPLYLDGGQFKDLESVKKEEWMRRRKMRIQQARQQANELTKNVRQNVRLGKNTMKKVASSTETASFISSECSCTGSEAMGDIALLQNECDILRKKKEVLRNEIARARAAIAAEKLKATKRLQKQSHSVATARRQLLNNLKPSPNCSRSPQPRPQIIVPVDVHRGADEASPNCTIRSREEEHDNLSDEDQDPVERRTASVHKDPIPSPRIRVYDHATGISEEVPRPPYRVIANPEPADKPAMSEYIAQEEEERMMRARLEDCARKEHLMRGREALRKEQRKKKAESVLKMMNEVEKRRKMHNVLSKSPQGLSYSKSSYPSASEGACSSGPAYVFKEPDPNAAFVTKSKMLEKGEVSPTSTSCNQRMRELLQELIKKLDHERNIRHEEGTCCQGHKEGKQESRPNSRKSSPESNKIVDKLTECQNKTPVRSGSPIIDTPKARSEGCKPYAKKTLQFSEKRKSCTSVNMIAGEGGSDRINVRAKTNSRRNSNSGSPGASSATSDSSPAEALRSSLTYGGVKVVVKVSDRNKAGQRQCSSKVEEEILKTPDDVKESVLAETRTLPVSTPLRRSPSQFSPRYRLLFESVTGSDDRSRTPSLGEYVRKTLDMGKRSIDELPVSSVSDCTLSNRVDCLGSPSPRRGAETTGGKRSGQTEALEFSEVAERYARRVEDLTEMLDQLNILPAHRPCCQAADDTSYMRLPVTPQDFSDLPRTLRPHPDCLSAPSNPFGPYSRPAVHSRSYSTSPRRCYRR